MDAAPLSRFQLMRLALVRIGGSLALLSGLIFLSAGTRSFCLATACSSAC